MTNPLRVWVFIDSQNVYRDARRAFHAPGDPSSSGQFDPRKLAQLLVDKGQVPGQKPRELSEVRVYMGLPSAAKDPGANAAHQRQVAKWQTNTVTVLRRPLRYPKKWPAEPAQEKGVDVALAVDLVFHAVRKFYDVGVVFSTDTDLLPALEAVCALRRAWGPGEVPRVEVASWKPTKKRLTVANHSIWCHHLEQDDYDLVKDPTNYTLPKS